VAGVGTLLSGAGPDMVLDLDPTSPSDSRWQVSQSSRFQRGDWDAEVRVTIVMTADETNYFVDERLVALNHGKVVFERRRSDKVPRSFS
jgi:hypothetical protein